MGNSCESPSRSSCLHSNTLVVRDEPPGQLPSAPVKPPGYVSSTAPRPVAAASGLEPSMSSSVPPGPSPYLHGLGRLLAAHVFSSDSLTERGLELPINTAQPTRVDNDEISGHILFLHRPEPGTEGDSPYAEHFRSKKRRFELRLQGRFKTKAEQIYFGGELAAPTELSWTTRSMATAMISVVNGLSAVRGVWLHCCPQETVHGASEGPDQNVERQHLVWPLLAADTLIVTPEGETPPLLTLPFDKTPLARKSAIRFNTSDTFTFVYYTQYIDYLEWSVCNMPVGWMNQGFSDFLGDSPINLVAYRLNEPKGEHSQLNKRYLARLVFTNTEATGEALRWHLGRETSSRVPAAMAGEPPSVSTTRSRAAPRAHRRPWLARLCWCCAGPSCAKFV